MAGVLECAMVWRFLDGRLLVRRREAARQLNVSPTTIRRLQRSGFLGDRRIGGLSMVPAADIERLARTGTRGLGAVAS